FMPLCFFFFQAEDGIRDRNVTGVQTCALPILTLRSVLTGICLMDPLFKTIIAILAVSVKGVMYRPLTVSLEAFSDTWAKYFVRSLIASASSSAKFSMLPAFEVSSRDLDGDCSILSL